LGLTSPYILIAEENIPSVRGASQAYGLSFTPGTWVESIQVTKGAGSVVNGFESISGQINTELIKPANDIPFYLNLYGSTDARMELNAHFNEKISDKWSSSLFVHGDRKSTRLNSSHVKISYAVLCWKKKTLRADPRPTTLRLCPFVSARPRRSTLFPYTTLFRSYFGTDKY